ncbi:MAG TPA: protein kinase [Bryobacteraceae bacterium]|nr:protein kinase [Bryobacteraceae bacterium]HOL72193.1 protein kinase [Bryobacteraceae bacterium]HOQ47318.1 protein kinase [Bryobacteraceae bacterium]HPU73897.1 protein kinase [Bryobacteraceae bacterium]
MAFNIGDTIGDYQIAGILGEGSSGTVYKVRNAGPDRIEAMKVLPPDVAENAELAESLVREIQTLAGLNHPNIAALYNVLRQDNQLLVFMEFVEGRTLEDRLREGPITTWEAVDAISQALSALAYAHERGIVHGGIQPANIMVTEAGQVKLMDFGIAKAMAGRKLATTGSLCYMSPEQVKGSQTIDGRSDLYSIGVSLYELVTGKRPFQGDSDQAIMAAHLEQQPAPPLQVNPALPSSLNEIIMTAIQKDPEQRFQTALALRNALEVVKQELTPPPDRNPAVAAAEAAPSPASISAQAAAPPEAQTAPAPPPPPPPAAAAGGKSHRALWIGVGALVGVAMLAAAAILVPKWFRTRASSAQLPVAEMLQQVGQMQQQPQLSPEASLAAETAPAAETPSVPEAPAMETQPATVGPVSQPAAAESTPQAVTQPEPVKPAVRAAQTSAPAGTPAPSRRAASQPVRAQQAAPQASAPASGPAAAQPVQAQQAASQIPPQAIVPTISPEALESARERLGMLGTRANAVIASLKNLQQQQQQMGVGLRGDITTAWKRMEFLLDESEAALKRQDLAATNKYLDQAEREIDKLEKFLGR